MAVCIAPPPFPPPPALPPGFSIVPFLPPVIPHVGICCGYQTPTFPIPTPVLAIAFPPGALAAILAGYALVKAYYDALQVPCPKSL